jgi:magnesium-transporting ATPase (P-type)
LHKPSLSTGYKRSDLIAIFERTSISCMNNSYSSFPAYYNYIFIAESENSNNINRRTPTFYLLSWISPTLLLIAIFTLLLALIVVAVLLYRRFIMKRRSPHGKCPRESKEAKILDEWRTPLVFERNIDFQYEEDYTVSPGMLRTFCSKSENLTSKIRF